jgi:hypothetical protein
MGDSHVSAKRVASYIFYVRTTTAHFDISSSDKELAKALQYSAVAGAYYVIYWLGQRQLKRAATLLRLAGSV